MGSVPTTGLHLVPPCNRHQGPRRVALASAAVTSGWRVEVLLDRAQALAEAAYLKPGENKEQKQGSILSTSNYQDLCFGPDFAPLRA